MTLEERMLALRERTGKSILVECSTNPHEWIVSVGWHYRGQWMKDVSQKSPDNLEEALSLVESSV